MDCKVPLTRLTLLLALQSALTWNLELSFQTKGTLLTHPLFALISLNLSPLRLAQNLQSPMVSPPCSYRNQEYRLPLPA